MIDNLSLNTILMTDRSDQADPRVANFSHARILDPSQKVTDLTKAETIFLAPEVC